MTTRSPSLVGTALWLALSAGLIHPQAHNVVGERFGVPVHVRYSQGMEDWESSPDWRKESAIHAAGFEGQNLFQRLFADSDWQDDYRFANALSKALYPVATPLISKGRAPGDMRNLRRVTGNKYTGAMLGVDALSDLLWDDETRDISLETRDGNPVLLLNWRF